jgi:hypothetical protein
MPARGSLVGRKGWGECHTDPGDHRVNGSEVSAAVQATIYAGTLQTSITHAREERGYLGGPTASNGIGVQSEREGQENCEDRRCRLI